MIYVDLTGLCDRKWTGIENYANDFFLFMRKAFHDDVCGLKLGSETEDGVLSLGENKGRFYTEYLLLPNFIKKHKNDLFIFPIFPPAMKCWKYSKNIVPIIYDTVPWNYRNTMSLMAKLIIVPRIKYTLKKADKIITESYTVMNQLKEINKNKCKYHIIYNCIQKYNLTKETDILKRLNLKENNYILSVSTIEPRKNFAYLMKIMNKFLNKNPDLKFVLVGRNGWGKKINNSEDISNIILTGYVTQEDLYTIYKNAHSFIMLPLDEGFGRTPIEAAVSGTPVIVSDIPIFHETLGDQCKYLPLNDETKAYELLNELYKSKNLIKPDELYFEKFNYDAVYKQIEELKTFLIK